MSNLAPQNDVLNLTPSKISKTSKNKEHESSDSKNSTQDNTESFLNSLLHSIDETNEFLPEHMKISQKEVVNEAMNRLQKGAFDESDKISIFESASFMQILSLLDKLKTDTADIKLANLSTQLSSLIKTEANFNALKGATNLNELLNIAKDLGLNVKNIKVDRLLDLKATFPNLDKADFFKGAVDNVFKEIINNKISNVSKNLNHHLQNTTHSTQKTNSKDGDSLLSQTLKNLDSMLLSKENKAEKNDKVKSKIEDATNIKSALKNVKNDELVKNLTEEPLNTKDKKNQDHQDHLNKDNNLKDLIKDSAKQDKNSNKELKDNATPQDLANLKDLNKESKDFNKELNKNQEKNSFNRENIQDLKNNNQNLNLDKNSQDLTLNLTQKDFNPTKETKNNKENKDIKQSLFDQKLNFENLNKTQVVQTKDNHSNFNNTNKETFTQEQTKTHSENADKNSLDELNSLVKDLNKITQNNTRNITTKETLQHFSQDLKEAVEQYKAPITKLSITLNPHNLGEVEVTLVQRGNNLHINFNSNTNAMNLFIQNQTEFKNSLVNMGFTGLEMNFSDQGKREQNQNQGKNRSGYGFKDALDGKNESEKVNLELVLAKYF